MLFARHHGSFHVRWLVSLVLALLGIALEACERLGQILKRTVLQKHSEANTDVSCSCSASLRSCALSLATMQSCRPLHQSFSEVRIVQILFEETLKMPPNVDVDLLALPQVFDLLL